MNITDDLQTSKNRINPSLRRWIGIFISCYLVFYCFNTQFITAIVTKPIWDTIVPFFASLLGEKNLLRTVGTGSGDLRFNFYLIALFALLSFILSTVMVFFFRRKDHNRNFTIGVYMLVRYFVIFQMLLYGAAKMLYLQFAYPNDLEMTRSLGDMTPMALLWTFMGYSKGYTIFTGCLEFFAGMFLLFRKTSILGALMAFGVMLNVMMLNYCYDVPVKLLSTHIVFMCLFLLAPAFQSLYLYFFTDQPIVRPEMPFFDYKDAEKVFFYMKIGAFGLAVLFFGSRYAQFPDANNSEPDFEGLLWVEDYRHTDENGLPIPVSDSKTWDGLIDGGDYIMVMNKNKAQKRLNKVYDKEAGTISFQSPYDSTSVVLYSITTDSVGAYSLKSIDRPDTISMRWKQSLKEFKLKESGFNWMQEYPNNN